MATRERNLSSKNGNMGTNLIFIGFLFLLNPDLITFDLIPDWIGYLFIASGLSRAALLDERLASAKKYAYFLALDSGIKFLSCGAVFSTKIESTRLTICFAFLVSEVCLSFLLCKNAFQGLRYLAVRCGGDLVLRSYDLAKTFVTVFLITKASIHFLPQLPVIFYSNIDADGDLVENYSQMVSSFRMTRGVLFVAGSLCLVAFGVYTARVLKAYLARLREDEPFSRGIYALYEEKVVRNERFQTVVAVKEAFFLFFLAFLFLADLYLDHINVVLKPLFPLFIFLGLQKLSRRFPVRRAFLSWSLASFFVALASYVFRLIYLFLDEDFPLVFPGNAFAWAAALLNGAATLFPLVFALRAVLLCAEKYTKFPYRKTRILLLALGILTVSLSFSQYLFVGRSDLVVWLQWGVFVVMLYVHKSGMDSVFAELEYQLT